MQSAGEDVTLLNVTFKPQFYMPLLYYLDAKNSCIHRLKKEVFYLWFCRWEIHMLRIELLYSQTICTGFWKQFLKYITVAPKRLRRSSLHLQKMNLDAVFMYLTCTLSHTSSESHGQHVEDIVHFRHAK